MLGNAYGDNVGEELGRFVLALAPWMLATIGVSVAFPLVFVAGPGRRLPLVALLVLVVHLPLAWLGDAVAGVYGLALALAVSTGVGLVAVLGLLGAIGPTLRGLALAAGIVRPSRRRRLRAARADPFRRRPRLRAGLSLYALLLARDAPERASALGLALPAGARVSGAELVVVVVLTWNGRTTRSLASMR